MWQKHTHWPSESARASFGSTASTSSTTPPRLVVTRNRVGGGIFRATPSRSTLSSRLCGPNCREREREALVSTLTMSPRQNPAARRRSSRPDRSSSSAPTPGGAEALKRWFAEKGLRKAKVGGVDIDGVWRGKYVSL